MDSAERQTEDAVDAILAALRGVSLTGLATIHAGLVATCWQRNPAMVLNIALGTVEAIAARFVNEYPDRRAEVLAEVVRLVDDVRAATGHRH